MPRQWRRSCLILQKVFGLRENTSLPSLAQEHKQKNNTTENDTYQPLLRERRTALEAVLNPLNSLQRVTLWSYNFCMISPWKKFGVLVWAFLTVMLFGAVVASYSLSVPFIVIFLCFVSIVIWGVLASKQWWMRLFSKTCLLLLGGFAFLGLFYLGGETGGYSLLWFMIYGIPTTFIIGIVALFLFRNSSKDKYQVTVARTPTP